MHNTPINQKLYHVTNRDNVESILKNGLIPHGAFVSLSTDPQSWYRDNLSIFEVNVDNIGLEMHSWLPELDEITVWGRIESNRLKLIKY